MQAATADEYDRMWLELDDFIRLNPGARHRRRWVLNELGSLKPGKLLDVGCGNGELLIAIRRSLKNFNDLTGVDLSPGVIQENRKRLPGIEFNVLDLEKELLPQQFQIIICSEVIEHVADQQNAMRNLARMLANKGVILLTCPTGEVYSTERRFGHTIHPTLTQIEEMARNSGLQMTHASNWGFPLYKSLKWLTNVNPQWSVNNFASGAYSASSKIISSVCYYGNFLNFPSSPWGCQLFVRLER